MESMVNLGIPHGSEGIYADYFSWVCGKRSGPREETCATSHEYLPLAQELARDGLHTAFTLEHVRTFHDELDFLHDLELRFFEVKNGFTDGLRRCVDLHRCIPSASVMDATGNRLRQSHFETRFVAAKLSGEDAVSILLAIEYASTDAYQETGEMEVCRMSLKDFLDRDAFETLFLGGLAGMLECRERGTTPLSEERDADAGLEQKVDTLLASQDYLRLAELVNERADEIDFVRILDLVSSSLESVRSAAESISRKAETVDIHNSSDVEKALQTIACEADVSFNAAILCEAVVKAMLRLPRKAI